MNISLSLRSQVHLLAPVGLLCLASFMLMATWMPWQIAAVLLLAWTPCLFNCYVRINKRDDRLGLFFAFLVVQSGHFMEHVVQMVQIHIIGLPFVQSHGLFGVLFDTEWFHFFFDSLFIPYCTVILLVTLNRRASGWLWLLLPLAFWHAAEHVAILQVYLKTHAFGSPGLLAYGGMLNKIVPITRPDLHFLYNFAEEAFIVLGFRSQTRER